MPPIEPVAAPHPALPIAKSNGQRGLSVRTACPYCGVGCGVLAQKAPDGAITVSGDPDHPANLGRLCSKGSALAETLAHDDRLLHPLIDGERASWDTALDRASLPVESAA